MKNWKPQLAERKVDETAFVNARRYWSLTVGAEEYGHDDDVTYELRVRHQYPEDEFRMMVWRDGDELEALTHDDYRARVKVILEHEPDRNEDDVYQWLYDRCYLVHSYDVFDRLKEYWNALKLLVSPAVNL
jgi:hypothetical protein